MKTLLRFLALAIVGASLSSCEAIKVSKGESNPGTLSQAQNLGFEEGVAGDGDPQAWDRRGGEPESYSFAIDSEVKRSGRSSARISLRPGVTAEDLDTSLIQCVESENFTGKTFHLNGWIKTVKAEGSGAAFWVGAYEAASQSTTTSWYPSSEHEWRSGDTDWSKYEAITEGLPEETDRVCFGPILYGSGTAWFDELTVEAK